MFCYLGDLSRFFTILRGCKLIILCFFVTLQARAGIQEVHFLPFNPVEKRTAITYIDDKGNWHRASKGAPEQVRWCFLCFPSFNVSSVSVISYGRSPFARLLNFVTSREKPGIGP